MNISQSEKIILDALRNAPSDNLIIQAIELVKSKYRSSADVSAYLARILAESGEIINLEGSVIADVASTGGPTSLSTIVTPLYLRAAGAMIPKLGVPGRPAGGIDCLAQIPGFKAELPYQDVISILQTSGYAHFLALGDFAPLDGRMFRLRQKEDAQRIPTLVTSSILAKKISVGIKYAGLDIRVATHGNFGTDWVTARENARLFVETAKLLDIDACALLTDAEYPYQPYIGRSEALVALSDFFEGVSSCWLDEHFAMCHSLAMATIPGDYRLNNFENDRRVLKKLFEENLNAQGANVSDFEFIVSETKKEHVILLEAENDGFCYYPLQKIRDVFVFYQKKYATDTNIFPDPVGMILYHRAGNWVEKGDVVASIRLPNDKQNEILSIIKPIICYPTQMPRGQGLEAVNV